MSTTPDKTQIVLHPGDYYFGGENAEVHTLLGSCISITLWHQKLKIGGMCHFVLPNNPHKTDNTISGRYADDCINLFKRSIHNANTEIKEYQAKIFGGGNIAPKHPKTNSNNYNSIGDRNASAALELLMHEKVPVLVAHVGEFGYRRIIFDIETGNVWVKFTSMKQPSVENTLSGKN